MSPSARKYVVTLVVFLLSGLFIGRFYDQQILGLLIAALLCLAWQVRQLLRFERASNTNEINSFGYGDGIWEQIFSRFHFERERAKSRKAAYRKLLREIRKSTDAMPDGAIILNYNNEIVTCNRAVKGLAGLRRTKDKGQRIDNILRDPQLAKLIDDNRPAQSVEIGSPVNDEAWLNCRVVPYGANQKLLLIRDVTERFRLNKMRRDFVANASHELRSPLTVIAGYLEALSEDDELPQNWIKPVAQMRSQSTRMNHILAELMELSRLENDGTAPRNEAIDVSSLLRDVRDSFFRQNESATINVDDDLSLKLIGIRAEIESVVVNLLSNALRYTSRDGEIVLAWRRTAKGASLIVEDNGDGIEAKHISRLTERFYRVDRGRSRDDGGVGLGLAIVKHVIVRHQGQLDITSEPGKGSKFCCSFPNDRLHDGSAGTLS